MLIATALIIFIDVFAVVMLAHTLEDAYTDNGQSMAERAMSLCMLYINSVSSETYNLATDESIISVLKQESGQTIVSRLDSACNYSLRIDAICVYAENGTVYTSSEISAQPTLEALKTNEGIAAFIEGDSDLFISLRTDNIAEIYHNISYQKKLGIVTCCRKVYDGDGNTIGYIFADILPSNLYSYIISGLNLQDAVTFISSGDMYFEYANNSENEALLNGSYGGWFKFEIASHDPALTLTIFTGIGEYVSKVTIMTAVLIGISAILIIITHFVVRHMTNNFTNRLESLATKMKSTTMDY